MEVITFESEVFKKLVQQIEQIAEFVFSQKNDQAKDVDDTVWLDNDQLSDLLGISTRTLQRLRDANRISYTKVGRKCIYSLSDVRQAVRTRVVECDPKTLDQYRKNYLLALGTKIGGGQ